MTKNNKDVSLKRRNSDQDQTNAKSFNKNTISIQLFDLPPSAFLFHLSPFLSALDLLSFRLSNKQCYNLLHKETESETLWKILLQRDFGIETDISFRSNSNSPTETSSTELRWNQVINFAAAPNPKGISIYGIDPTNDDFLLEIPSSSAINTSTPVSFTVWKYWLKTSRHVYDGKDVDAIWSGEDSTSLKQFQSLQLSSKSFSTWTRPPILWAPYFLRAAKFWRSLLQWCDANEVSGTVGRRIRNSLSPADLKSLNLTIDKIDDQIPINYACRMVLLAVYSFTSGQSPTHYFDGMLGGYNAYSFYFCMFLKSPGYIDSSHLLVAQDVIGFEQDMDRYVYMDCHSGALLRENGNLCLSSSQTPRPDDFLIWLEEYVRRLSHGVYRVNNLGTTEQDPEAISIFPQHPNINANGVIENSSSTDASMVSRAVTKGVEIIASAVYAPQGDNRFAFIYCIRIRLLTPGENGYMSEEDRGFKSCQLLSRHWDIKDNASGKTDSVDGNGVIGFYPIVYEGGFKDRKPTNPLQKGVFQYQSCTGPMTQGGHFAGHIQFVPGCLSTPAGPEFRAKLNPFELNPKPPFWY